VLKNDKGGEIREGTHHGSNQVIIGGLSDT
jgi:hypothetical protein